MEVITPLREKLLAATSDDPWERFGRWYFQEIDARPISPWSTVSLKEYVDGLVSLGDKDSLDYAIALSQPIPAWMVKIMALRSKLEDRPRRPAHRLASAKDDD